MTDGGFIFLINVGHDKEKYNGIVFRLRQEDLPAYFGSWIGATTTDNVKKEITNLKMLGAEFRQTVLLRLGEELARRSNLDLDMYDHKKQRELFLKLAQLKIQKSSKSLTDKTNDVDFMTFALEDYQIVLANSISSDRILKVLPQGDEFGRVIRLRKKYGT